MPSGVATNYGVAVVGGPWRELMSVFTLTSIVGSACGHPALRASSLGGAVCCVQPVAPAAHQPLQKRYLPRTILCWDKSRGRMDRSRCFQTDGPWMMWCFEIENGSTRFAPSFSREDRKRNGFWQEIRLAQGGKERCYPRGSDGVGGMNGSNLLKLLRAVKLT